MFVLFRFTAAKLVAEFASYFNIPMISWVATDPDLGDKMKYSTLGRTLGPFDKMAEFLLTIYK